MHNEIDWWLRNSQFGSNISILLSWENIWNSHSAHVSDYFEWNIHTTDPFKVIVPFSRGWKPLGRVLGLSLKQHAVQLSEVAITRQRHASKVWRLTAHSLQEFCTPVQDGGNSLERVCLSNARVHITVSHRSRSDAAKQSNASTQEEYSRRITI